MKFKFAILFILTSFLGFSQDIQSMRNEAGKMYEANVKQNYDEIIEFYYPKIFDFVTKEDFKKVLIQTFSSEDFKVEINNVNPNFSNSEIKKIDDKSFILLEHDYFFQVKFKKDISENATNLIEVFKKSIEPEEAIYNKESNSISIKKRQHVLAVSDKLTNFKWKFINLEKDQTVLKMLIDETILKQLGLL